MIDAALQRLNTARFILSHKRTPEGKQLTISLVALCNQLRPTLLLSALSSIVSPFLWVYKVAASSSSQSSSQKREKRKGRKAKEKAHYRMPVPHLIEGLS